jgi:tyrosyl-tRNA synthetase
MEPEKRYAQRRLASEATELIHGFDGLQRAEIATKVLFGTSLKEVRAKDLLNAFEQDSRLVRLSRQQVLGLRLDKFAHLAGACQSRCKSNHVVKIVILTRIFIAEAFKLIQSGGLYLNQERISDASQPLTIENLIDQCVCVLRTGKTNYRIVHVIE